MLIGLQFTITSPSQIKYILVLNTVVIVGLLTKTICRNFHEISSRFLHSAFRLAALTRSICRASFGCRGNVTVSCVITVIRYFNVNFTDTKLYYLKIVQDS